MLSATTVPGIPWRANVTFITFIVAAAVLDETGTTSGYFEK